MLQYLGLVHIYLVQLPILPPVDNFFGPGKGRGDTFMKLDIDVYQVSNLNKPVDVNTYIIKIMQSVN